MAVIDKEHTKEYKRCRAELKKRSTDTLRLQKKAKKGQSDSIQSLVESSMHDITQRKADLEEVERRSLRAAMIEERTRFCTFVNLLQPVVQEEFEVMYELGHLQEAMETITNVTKNPNVLPQASEELILETKTPAAYLYPESPGGSHGYSNSLGSRKSSVCSISSINSSGSSNSPGHPYQRSLSQVSENCSHRFVCCLAFFSYWEKGRERESEASISTNLFCCFAFASNFYVFIVSFHLFTTFSFLSWM